MRPRVKLGLIAGILGVLAAFSAGGAVETTGASTACEPGTYVPRVPSFQKFPAEIAEAAAANRAKAVEVADQLLTRARLPEGATAVCASPTGAAAEESPGGPATPELVDRYLRWHVPGEPQAVIAWIEARAPAGGERTGRGGSGTKGRQEEWNTAFTFTVARPLVIAGEQLQFITVAAPGGGTALRADAQVVWAVPRSTLVHIPAGVSAIGVSEHEGGPSGVSRGPRVSRASTIDEPAAVQEVIALIERLDAPGGGINEGCPRGAFVLKLQFEGADHSPLATFTTSTASCGVGTLSAGGHKQRLEGSWKVERLVPHLDGANQ